MLEKYLPSGESSRQIVVALYPYEAHADTDINLRKGDRMEVLDDDSNAEWWNVINLRNKKKGWIPKNYVAPETSLEAEE